MQKQNIYPFTLNQKKSNISSNTNSPLEKKQINENT
jgi:hypothetical protein